MKAKNKFKRMYTKLPYPAKRLIWMDKDLEPRSLNTIFIEIEHETELGKRILNDMGFKDD